LIALFILSACGGTASDSVGANSTSSSSPLNVVAAENFYGDIVKQLGGSHVTVTSILADPNVDPHEYESNVNNAKAVFKANLVIENGGGYDSWMDKLLAGSPNSNRIVIQGFDSASSKIPDNVHVWYSIDNVQSIAQAITSGLKKLDPANSATFDSNYQTFNTSLSQIRQTMSAMKSRYNGTPVGLTETIFQYQAVPLGLKVLTPEEFQKAIAEGNDPPADSAITAENQIKGKQVKVLIYNEQTISPVTTRLQNDAKAAGIPIVPVTETMPANKTYQSWMLAQLGTLSQALGRGKNG
jgi:zinc/manganese transport system substrate-binding protein